jgi:uncharacterized protein YndB with AHSA1/START domain
MNPTDLIARAEITIKAPVTSVWDALTNPSVIRSYMFGTTVVSDWEEGSEIKWFGEWNEKKYEDHGMILTYIPCKKLEYTHFSPLSGLPDIPENYHHVSIEILAKEFQTKVFLSQDNNATEESRKHSEENWLQILSNLRKLLEKHN